MEEKKYEQLKLFDEPETPKAPAPMAPKSQPNSDAEERKKASQLFKMDLSKPKEQEEEFTYDPIDDAPDSPVVGHNLTTFMKQYLREQGLSPEFINAAINDAYKNQNAARWYKQRFKEWFERKNGGK